MSRTAEQTETLRDLELVALRRLGANRVHFALVMPESVSDAAVFGTPCKTIEAPVSAFCRRVLRGNKVVIPIDKLDGWYKQKHVCRECVMICARALEKASA